MVTRSASGLVLAASIALATSSAHAQSATLIAGLGGPADFGTNSLPRAISIASPPIDLSTSFPNGILAAGTSYTTIYVNNTGNVSLGMPYTPYPAMAFPGATVPILAPWWSDVDIRAVDAGSETDGIYWYLETGRFIATWNSVGYFDMHRALRDTFQMIVTDASATAAPGDVDIEYRYNLCQWDTTDAGPIPAIAGYDFTTTAMPPPMPFGLLYGSGSPLVLQLCSLSNVGSAGVWQMHLRGGVMQFCGDGVLEPGEECDPAMPPFMGCSVDCRMCGAPTCLGDAGLPDVVFPDVPMLDIVVPDVTSSDVSDVVEVSDSETTDVGFVDTGAMDAVEAGAFVDAASDVADAGLDADAQASPDAADADGASNFVVQRYGGGGRLSCNVVTPGARGDGAAIASAFVLLASCARRRSRGRRTRRADDAQR